MSAAPWCARSAARSAASTGAAAQPARSGQSRHFGARAVQIVAPTSIIAEFQSCAVPGTSAARARASSSASPARRGCSSPKPRAVRDPAHVRVERDVVEFERERAHGRRRVRPDARQRQQRVAVARQHAAVALDDGPRQRVQPHRARVVAEAAPQPHRVARFGCRERGEIRKRRDERFVERDHAVDLRLLQHELAHQHAVRVARLPPRQMRAAVRAVPVEQRARSHAADDLSDALDPFLDRLARHRRQREANVVVAAALREERLAEQKR